MTPMHRRHVAKTRRRSPAAPAARQVAPGPKARRQTAEIRHILGRGTVQPKLTVSEPNDALEQEADRVAEEVMRMDSSDRAPAMRTHGSPPAVQRACSGCGALQTEATEELVQREAAEEEELLQPKRSAGQRGVVLSFPGLERPMLKSSCACGGGCSSCRAGAVRPVDDAAEHEAGQVADRVVREAAPARGPPALADRGDAHDQAAEQAAADLPGLRTAHAIGSRIASLRGGQLLPASERAFFEPRFGRDFGAVRVHTDAGAADLARALSARAFTVGHDVVFGAGQYAPNTVPGRLLLAHELAHTVQQSRRPGDESAVRREVLEPGGSDGMLVQRQAEPGGTEGSSESVETSGWLDAGFTAISAAAALFPGLAPLAAASELIRGVVHLWNHRHEHLEQLLTAIGTVVETVPALARAKLEEFLAGVGTASEATLCVGNQLLAFLDSLIQNWREVLESFLLDLVFVGLFQRSIPTIIENLDGLFDDLTNAELRSATDRGVAIMTELNTIAGVIFLWCALITTVVGAVAGSEVPVAGNAAGGAAGLTLAEVVGVALVAVVVATEATRTGRGIDDMVRYWDDVPLREAGCRQVAEGVFSIALTLALFFLGPSIQRVARSIIQRAAASVRSAATALSREVSAALEAVTAPVGVTPEGLAVPFAGPLPEPVVTPRPPARAPSSTTARPPLTVAEPAAPAPAPELAPGTRAARGIGDYLTPATEDPLRRSRREGDACVQVYGLQPNINDRWHIQRPRIRGHTTVSEAAFRLDAGVDPPAGQDTTQASRDWVRAIGQPADDAGHVIGNRFGGTANYNSPTGNIFPQDLSFNRGTMRSYDAVAAGIHGRGGDVCVHIGLVYDSASDLRPAYTLYTYLYRSPGATGFNPPIGPAQVPNP